jgi:predicted nucleotidyltransferase
MLPRAALEAIRNVADGDPEIRALYLFGSRATGQARRDSDIDIGVLYRRGQSMAAALALEQTLEDTLRERVDVVDVGHATAFLALEIVRGERIFCRDEDETDRFDVYVLRRAGDLAPFERARQTLLLGTPRG